MIRSPASLIRRLAIYCVPVLLCFSVAIAHSNDPMMIDYVEAGTAPPAASAFCTIIYYDLCGGQGGVGALQIGDKIGVVYDLAASCGGGDGHECQNVMNYWYWSSHNSNYNTPNVHYSLWTVDENDCLVQGSPFVLNPFTSGWNTVPGLGSTTEDRVAIVATVTGTIVYPITDNNVANPGCNGGAGNSTSYKFKEGVGPNFLCPPAPYTDALGPVNLLVRSVWNCPAATGVAGPAGEAEWSSWSELKRLFQ